MTRARESDAPGRCAERGSATRSIIGLILLVAAAAGVTIAFALRREEPSAPPSRGTAAPAPAPRPEPAPAPAPAPADAPGTVRYRGRVTDPLARPIAGATIASGAFPAKDEVVVRTGEGGEFEIALASAPPIVRIEAPGCYRQVVELERDPEVPYLLFLGGRIRGVVTGPVLGPDRTVVDTPVPEVRIEVAGVEGWFHEVVTDDAGRYEVTAPPGAVVLTVRAADYRDERLLDVEAVREGEVVRDIRLEPGVQVELVVIGDGEMVADAHVRALTDLGEEGEARTDALGKATIRGLTPGNGKMVIVRPGYAAELHALVLGENRSLIRRPVQVERAIPYTLEVVDAAGAPRPDAVVRIRHEQIELASAPAGEPERLQILGRDRVYWFDVVAPSAPRTRVRFRIPTDGPPHLRIVLPEGGRFRGAVVDGRGRPVAGAGVLIAPLGETADQLGPPRLTTTGIDGSFRTELFAPGPYRVQAHHPRLGRNGIETRIVDGEDTDLGKITLGE